MKRKVVSFRANANLARQLWGELSRISLRTLRDLTVRYSLSVAAGALQFLDGRWYVTHSGLLQLASRKGCRGIKTVLQERLSDAGTGRWVKPPHSNGSSNGQPRLRDRLCVLIRQYDLDPILVKAYAAEFCGTPTLKEASRELIESFMRHLDASAKENRDTLLCKLNSYAQPVEVKP